jgi:prophage maintenance system killer protein
METVRYEGKHQVIRAIDFYKIKKHPFREGNPRIGLLLFIQFLAMNRALHRANGEAKINDNALVALALLIAASDPGHKDILVKLIINVLWEAAK